MKMVVMPPEWPDLAEPRAITAHGIAKLLLDTRMNEDALDFGVICSATQNGFVGRSPLSVID
ncbi:hypothetical protein R0K18_33030, partial [Pantoea sp. SIMBA_133]